MLVYCWASVADGGPTLSQNWFNVTGLTSNVGLMLGQCRGRRANIEAALFVRPVLIDKVMNRNNPQSAS